MKAILLIVVAFLCFSDSSNASNYYFSTVSGNDSRTPEQAQDASTPWKTLNKLNSFFSSLKPGDSVLLKRDEIFYGSIIVKKSGLAGSPIVISDYGPGEKPVITSLVPVTDWVSKGNGIWESYNASFGSAVNMVLMNDAEQEMGRYPNSDATNKGYLNFESHSGKTSITDNDLNTSINWAGAELVTRPRHWILNRSIITAQSGKKISYTTSSPYEPYENYGYFIQNSIKALDKTGEWYFDPASKKISVYFGSNSPSSYDFEVATTSADLVSSSSYSYVVFDNLAVKGSNGSGFFVNSGSNFYIQNCDILFSGITGILAHGNANMHIENCTISNSNSNGIDFEYGVSNAIIKNNKILNTAVIAGLMQNGEGIGLAIYTNGDGNTIQNNEIRNTGFIGITFYGSNVTIKNNFIDSFCFVKDDGGGIYSHGGATATTNRKLTGNIIINGIGAGPGTDIATKRSVTGIYMDADITNVEITDNTVTTCYQGIFIQSSTAMVIKNNTVYDNTRQLTMIERAGDNPVRNSVITQNIFFSKAPDQYVSYVMSPADDIGSFGRLDSNYYARPIDDRIDIYNSRVTSGNTIVENFDLEGWQKRYNKDAASKRSAKQILPYKLNSLVGSNKFVNGGDFTSDVKGVSATSCALALNTSGVLDGGCLQATPSASSSAVYFKVGAITAGKKYILRYSLKGSVDNNMSIAASLKQTASPYDALTTVQARKITTDRTENEMVFVSATSEASANINFKIDAQAKFYLDNIKFYEADASLTDIDDSLRFIYNETSSVKSVQLAGNYSDVKGKIYSGSASLQPYASIVLIKTSGGTQNTAPIIEITSPTDNATIDAGTQLDVKATASDPDGTVTKVEFYNGGTLLGSTTSRPYSFSWTNVPAGNYTLTAKATDDDGAVTTSSPVYVSVTGNQAPPVVSLTSPVNATTSDALATVLLEATAASSDPNSSIDKVEFYNGSTLLTTQSSAPYSWSWLNVPAGNYTIYAKAYDNNGLTTKTDGVSITVTSLPDAPVVKMTSPANNAGYNEPATINMSASATGSNPISKVEFFSGDSLLAAEYSSPYTFTWDEVPSGSYTLTAKATDDNGLSTTSAGVSVTVAKVSNAPVVTITAPVSNSTYTAPATINLVAAATDVSGSISKVEFYNGNTLLKTEHTAPYTYTWSGVAVGNYSITAVATDNNGLTTTSAVDLISVLSGKAPGVIITSPASGTNYNAPATIYLTASASDPATLISKVEFYSGKTLLKTEHTSPYTYNWQNVAAGSYTVTAKSTNKNGLVTTSAPVYLTVQAKKAARSSSLDSSSIQASVASGESSAVQGSTGNSDIAVVKNGKLLSKPDSLKLVAFRLLPNPAVNTIQLYFDELSVYQKATLTIQNVSGAILKRYPVSISGRKMDVDISSLNTGVYIIGLSGDSFTINKKFIKIR